MAVVVVFSEAPDWVTCTSDTVHLVRAEADGQVIARAGVQVVSDGELALRLEHDALADGRWEVAVQTGVEGCLSAFGQGVAPFSSEFWVEVQD